MEYKELGGDMITKKFVGWAGRSYIDDEKLLPVRWKADKYTNEEILVVDEFFPIFKAKGKKDEWDFDDWPPYKVEIEMVIHDE